MGADEGLCVIAHADAILVCAPLMAGVAQASFLGDRWYVNRVLVRDPAARGRGLGERLVRALLLAIEERGPAWVIVEPGGYGSELQRLQRFYAKCGFVLHEEPDGDTWMEIRVAPAEAVNHRPLS